MTRIRKTTATIALGASLLGGSATAIILTTAVSSSGVSAATAIEYGASSSKPGAVSVTNPTAVEYASPAATSNATAIEYGL